MPLAFLAMMGCPPDRVAAQRSDPEVVEPTSVALHSVPSDSGVTVATTDRTHGCDDLPDGAGAVTLMDHWTGPDFDFDAQGRLVSIDGDRLVAWPGADALSEPVGDVDFDARGVQVDHLGAVLVSSYAWGTVDRFNPLTGASMPMIGGMVGPTGLEVGDPDVVYVAESGSGRVFAFDGRGGVAAPIASVSHPTHLALSPAGDVLYVSDLSASQIWAIDRLGDRWDAPRVLVQLPEPIAAIEVDLCGNVYGVTYRSGRVFRFDPLTGEPVLLAQLDANTNGAFVTARWGSDRGPWRRDVLYVSDYFRLWAVEVGVRGRDQPVDALP